MLFCDVKLWFHLKEYDVSKYFCLKIDFTECSKQARQHTLMNAFLTPDFKVSENHLTQTLHSLVVDVVMRWAK